MSELEEIVRTTCPRDCYDTCGVTVHKRNGAIESVRGDPAHFVSQGQLCTKCSIGYNNEWLDPRCAPDPAAPPRRAQGRGPLRAGVMGRRDGRDCRSAQADRRERRTAGHPQYALQRHHLAHRVPLPDAFLQPARRDRGQPRHDLQHGWPRGFALRIWNFGERLRSANRRRRRVHPRVGRKSLSFGSARAGTLDRETAGQGRGNRSGAHGVGRGRGYPSSAVSGKRCGAGLFDAPRYPARRPGRSRLRGSAHRGMGRARTDARANVLRHGARRRPACPPA